jgi:hypothetical protein
VTIDTSLKFTIEKPDGTIEELCVDSDSVVVGSGAHCEIRLIGDEVPAEQLKVSVRGTGVFAEAHAMHPPALVNGIPFTQGRLLPDTPLRIGRFSVRVEWAPRTNSRTTTRAGQQRTNPLVLVAAAIGFPLGFYLLLVTKGDADALGAPPTAPSLWQVAKPAECVHQDQGVARAQALSDLANANAKRERSPFSPENGVESVTLYEKAAACFAHAGMLAEAQGTSLDANRLREATVRQFHVHQVRLERALATKEYEAASTEARIIQGFIGSNGGEYRSWLADLQRGIKVRFSGKD